MNEKEFWLVLRRALIMIIKIIERRYLCKDGTGDKIPPD
jgi:hypothetical protein